MEMKTKTYGWDVLDAGMKSGMAYAKESKKERQLLNERRKIARVVPLALFNEVPAHMQPIIREIALDRSMNEGVAAMMERERSFPTPMAALLAGVAVLGDAARHFDRKLDALWAGRQMPTVADEVIIGGGLHAAVYSSVRAAMGKPKPLVLERSQRAGGAFAVSQGPSFYLNSRNRPGDLSLPGEPGALNVIPGGPIQPADIDSSEYQTNAALAWAIRAALAMNADVITGREVTGVESDFDSATNKRQWLIYLEDGDVVIAKRVIVATGLSNPRSLGSGDRVVTFEEFMGRMDEPFPLRGMQRVAVIGAGDSGKTAIEALTGQGPSSRWSVASVDWVDRIDWYGCKQFDRASFETCNRGRYRGIGSVLPQNGDTTARRVRRVRPLPERAIDISPGFNCAFVNDRPYDYVVSCIGYYGGLQIEMPGDYSYYTMQSIGNRQVAKKYDAGEEVFVVGPGAEIPLSDRERAAIGTAATVDENKTALFRYASRTAALASSRP